MTDEEKDWMLQRAVESSEAIQAIAREQTRILDSIAKSLASIAEVYNIRDTEERGP